MRTERRLVWFFITVEIRDLSIMRSFMHFVRRTKRPDTRIQSLSRLGSPWPYNQPLALGHVTQRTTGTTGYITRAVFVSTDCLVLVIQLFRHILWNRFETRVETGGVLVVIGLYCFVELQDGRGRRKLLWLHNSLTTMACSGWVSLGMESVCLLRWLDAYGTVLPAALTGRQTTDTLQKGVAA